MAKTRKLYVYIPGFEYDSKGPLHIDAILVIVSKGELILENGIPTNLISTYCYKEKANSETGKIIKGDLVFRSLNTDLEKLIKDYYPTSKLKITSPQWTEDSKRSLPGFFYDFITTKKEEEITHHIIGIHDIAQDCQSVSNFVTDEHDGLFCLELDQLDVDLKIQYYFYSRIKDCPIDSNTESIIIGEVEDIATCTLFLKSNYTNFDNEYVLIGELSVYYNPVTSGSTITEPKVENSVPQYFNLKEWGPDNTKTWEVPVNADFLVTDMTEGSGAKKQIKNRYIYQLYSYCVDKTDAEHYLKHYLNPSLHCNTYPFPDYGPFYGDFYKGILTFPGTPKSNSWSFKSNKINALCLVATHSPWIKSDEDAIVYWLPTSYDLNDGLYLFEPKSTVNYKYIICPINLESFKYLYSLTKSVQLYNLAQDSLCGEPSQYDSTSLFFVIDTTGLYRPIDYDKITSKGEYFCVDYDNYNNVNGHWGYNYENDDYIYPYKSRDFLKESDQLSAQVIISATQTVNNNDTLINISTSSPITGWYENNASTITANYRNKTLLNFKQKYVNTRKDPTSEYKTDYIGNIESISQTEGSGRPYFTTSSLLDTGNWTLDLNSSNEVNIQFTLEKVEVPYAQYHKTLYRDNDGSPNRIGEIGIKKKIEKFASDLALTSVDNMVKKGYGKTSMGILQMYQINLAESNIEYNNKGSYSIVPNIYNDNNGYFETSLVDVNIIPTNLLDPNPSDSDTFEIARILPNQLLSYPWQLYRLKTSASAPTTYDTTFCDECRFIGAKDLTEYKTGKIINLNKKISLDKGLYILKITDYSKIYNLTSNSHHTVSTFNDHTLQFNLNGITYKNIKCKNNLWVFYVNDNLPSILILDQIKANLQINGSLLSNVIGGIGLYKIDLTDTTKSSIQFLQLYLDTYKLNHACGNVFYIDPSLNDSNNIFNTIIFPTAYCAKENVGIGNKINRDSSRMFAEYGNNITYGVLRHDYNFKYLPKLAKYQVAAFYTIPNGDLSKLTENDEIELLISGIDISHLRENRIKI